MINFSSFLPVQPARATCTLITQLRVIRQKTAIYRSYSGHGIA